jgi:hypothetical protein
VDSVLEQLRRSIPDGCMVLVGVTMEDLFDTQPDLFVAGMADARRTGVRS